MEVANTGQPGEPKYFVRLPSSPPIGLLTAWWMAPFCGAGITRSFSATPAPPVPGELSPGLPGIPSKLRPGPDPGDDEPLFCRHFSVDIRLLDEIGLADKIQYCSGGSGFLPQDSV